MNKIYIASPFGFSESGRLFLYEKLIPLLTGSKLLCIDPWKLTPEDLIDKVNSITDPIERRNEWIKLNRVIAENNKKGIEESDGVLAVLDGTDVDSGTAAEIGYAAAINKKICGYRSDFRRSGDNDGAVINLQVEYFILNSGGRIVTNLAELKDELNRLFIF
jgi:nucleoside 2-deoxyribosyltransferase